MISLRADRRDVAAGARALVPWLAWLAGIVPFGLVIGVSAARAEVPALRTGSPRAAIPAGMPALWAATALLPT